MRTPSKTSLFLACLALVLSVTLNAQTKEQDLQAIQALVETNKDVSIDVKTTEKKTGEIDTGVTLQVDTYPVGATVYLNGFHAGVTPLSLKGVTAGGYRITLKRDHYKPIAFFLNLDSGKTVKVYATLKETTGTLKVKISPEDADVYADYYRVTTGETLLPVGSYEVRVRKFGYEDYRVRVEILEDKTTPVEAKLSPASFRVEELRFSRPVFNPENPGLLGKTEINFQVTAPGKGVLHLFSESGEEVYTATFPPFTTWNQSREWNGRGNKYAILPDGTYRAVLSAESAGGQKIELQSRVTLDRSLKISYRNILSGLSGLLFAPTAQALPPGSYQVGLNYLVLASNAETKAAENLNLFQAGGAFGLIPDLELSPVLSMRITDKAEPPEVMGSLGAKYLLYSGKGIASFSFAATAKGSVANELASNGFSQFPGFSAGLVGQFNLGPFALVAAPELAVSPYPIGAEKVSWAEKNFYSWAGGRFGLFFDSGHLISGFSTAFSTKAFSEGSGLSYPIHTGYEIHWLLPDTLFYLSGYAMWEYYPHSADRVFLGGGLGIIY